MTPLILTQFGFLTLGTLGYLDLIAATTNAFNGALLARRPSHYKHFTLMGVILLGFVGGIGGGIIRDVLCNRVPSPLLNPWYIIACLAAGGLALLISFRSVAKFQDGLFQFMTAFSLPWYATVGAQVALDTHLGYNAAVLIGVIATTGGRWIIDIACGLVPKQLVRGGFFVLTAVLTATLYVVCKEAFGLSLLVSTVIAWVFGFSFRLTSQALGWEEWEPWEPADLKTGEKTDKTLVAGLRAELEPEKKP